MTIYKWKLAQFNMADARKGGGTKWKGLAMFMDEHKLHGIALQELRISDQTTFMANKHLYIKRTNITNAPLHRRRLKGTCWRHWIPG